LPGHPALAFGGGFVFLGFGFSKSPRSKSPRVTGQGGGKRESRKAGCRNGEALAKIGVGLGQAPARQLERGIRAQKVKIVGVFIATIS
jgi:hypothetical protein